MTKTIQAKQTEYRGYTFRSRTEARWAYYFDLMEIAWDYEPGYVNIGMKKDYLPDFWLPRSETWAEVKGQQPTDDEFRRCEDLCHVTGNPCVILDGIPQFKPYLHLRWVYAYDSRVDITNVLMVDKCPYDPSELVSLHNYGWFAQRINVINASRWPMPTIKWADPCRLSGLPDEDEGDFGDAKAIAHKARSVRFDETTDGRSDA